jgi:hypothetical protein
VKSLPAARDRERPGSGIGKAGAAARLPPVLVRTLTFQLRERAFVYKQRRRLVRLAPFQRREGNAAALIAAARAKNLVFTVTAGRTGTTYLQRLLALCPETVSLHEPEPSFVPVLRLVQKDGALARRFLLEYKLPFIVAQRPRNYVETGHLFGKGFLEPLLDLGIVPRIVALRRHPRPVALSLLARRTVPGRSKLGLKYLVHPGDPGVLPLRRWQAMTDYQLCFWYALEMERRQQHYCAQFAALGAVAVDVTAEELHDAARFLAVVRALGLLGDTADPAPLIRGHAELTAVVHNPNRSGPAAAVADAEREEQGVWAAIAAQAPALRRAVASRYPDPIAGSEK